MSVKGDTDLFRRIEWLTGATMRDCGNKLVRQIVDRTQSCVAPGGWGFMPYSDAYAKQKGVDPNAVDLTSRSSGPHMLDHIKVLQATPTTLVIGFDSSTMAARARAVQKTRPFFDVEEEWIDDISRKIAAGIRIR
jgi:hypothetical protein